VTGNILRGSVAWWPWFTRLYFEITRLYKVGNNNKHSVL